MPTQGLLVGRPTSCPRRAAEQTFSPESVTAWRGHHLGACPCAFRCAHGGARICGAVPAAAGRLSTTWGMLPLAAGRFYAFPSGGDRHGWQAARAELMSSCGGTIGTGCLAMRMQQEGRQFGHPSEFECVPVLCLFQGAQRRPGRVLVRRAVRRVGVCGQPKHDWGDLGVQWVSSSHWVASRRARRGPVGQSVRKCLCNGGEASRPNSFHVNSLQEFRRRDGRHVAGQPGWAGGRTARPG